MKIHNITEGYSYMSDSNPQPEQSVVDRFAGVAASQRSYYIMKWAEEKGISTDDAMYKAGYVQDGYIGAGAWNWRYVGMDESVQEDEVDGADYSQDGMIGTPDGYYDAEQRQEAYRDLKDALDGAQNWQEDSIKDGVCPECAGSGYMDGEYEDEDGNEGSECYGFGNFGCDEGEMTQNDDGLPNWAEIAKHDERQAEKANRGPAPSQEQIMKILPRLHDDYVKSGRYNAFELPSILRQMYPELGKRQASSYVADFFKTFEEDIDEVAGAKDCWDGYKKDGTQAGTGKNKGKRVNKCVKEENLDESSDEVMVAKMLAKALGDENRWTEMSAPELYAELESTSPDVADMIRNLAKMLYDVKLQERAYKDVGVADTVKDQRGKEFNFDKSSKKFKSQDGEEADVTTKLGKDLMRIRKNQMKKTTPSYKTKKNQGIMASIEEAYGDNHEITLEDNEDFNDVFGVLGYSLCEQDTFEAEYQGRKVKLNKPMQGDTKKFKVYVKDPKTGNVKKVNFGHGGSSVKGKAMKIRKSNPKARKSFRARHNCDNPGPKTKARYWSCRKW